VNPAMEVEVRIYRDRMEVCSTDQLIHVDSESPFSTSRLLVGEFKPAVDCLKRGLNEIGALAILTRKPSRRIRAMEINSGGLSAVERRCLLELGSAAGANQVEVE